MPPLPVVPGVLKLELSGVYHDSKWVNIYYVHYSGTTPTSTTLHSYLTTIDAGVGPAYQAEMSTDNSLTLYTITDLSSSSGAVAENTVSRFGVRTGDFNPANVCMVASLEILRRYRGGHPRRYLPWGTSGTFASGSTTQWDPAFVTDCQAKFSTITSALVGVTIAGTVFDNNVNVSYRSGGVVRPTAVVDDIVSTTIRSRVCSQRRRLGKVGA